MAGELRRHTRVMGVWVTDQAGYGRYRAAIAPVLARFGGRFGYDLVVSEVLKSEVEAPINRVFTLVFPDRRACEGFFSDPEYVEIRAKRFVPSVGSTTVIAEL
jgi:uncharacterized protein (DUF1330 family)